MIIFENQYNKQIKEHFKIMNLDKIHIVKVNELVPDNCCYGNNNLKVFSESVQQNLNKCGTLENGYSVKVCNVENDFWKNNFDKFILVTKENPKNGFKNFAKYQGYSVWFATNNILEYKPDIFNFYNEANEYVKNFMTFTYSIEDFPPMLSCLKINLTSPNIKVINSNMLGLCGLSENFWQENNNKIAIISYLPTFNSDKKNLEPFAYYNNQLIWFFSLTNFTDLDIVMKKIIFPLNISYMWDWKNNNTNYSLPFFVDKNMIKIKDSCLDNPSSCRMSNDILNKIKNTKYVGISFVDNNITEDCGTLYDKRISFLNYGDNYDTLIYEYLNFNITGIMNFLKGENKKILEHYKDFMNNPSDFSKIEKFSNIEYFNLVEPPPFSNITFPEIIPNNITIQEQPSIVSAPYSPSVQISPIVTSDNENDEYMKNYEQFLKKRTEFIKAKQTELKYLEMFNFSCFMVVVIFLFIIFGSYIFLNKEKQD